MIPDSAATLLGLLGCIAPGLVYQLRREQHRPQQDETALREASRVALTSLLFTGVSLALLALWTQFWMWLPDLDAWLKGGSAYAAENLFAVGAFLTLEVTLACLLAVGGERLTRGDVTGDIAPEGVLWKVARSDPPLEMKRVRLWVATEDGTQFRGALRHYTPGTALDDREIALGGRALERLANTGGSVWEPLTDYDAVVIPGSAIRHMTVQYLGPHDEVLHSSGPRGQKARDQARRKRLRLRRDRSEEPEVLHVLPPSTSRDSPGSVTTGQPR